MHKIRAILRLVHNFDCLRSSDTCLFAAVYLFAHEKNVLQQVSVRITQYRPHEQVYLVNWIGYGYTRNWPHMHEDLFRFSIDSGLIGDLECLNYNNVRYSSSPGTVLHFVLDFPIQSVISISIVIWCQNCECEAETTICFQYLFVISSHCPSIWLLFFLSVTYKISKIQLFHHR